MGCCVHCQVLEYKYKGCVLKYAKVNDYNVEVIRQDRIEDVEKIYIPNEIIYNDTTYYVIGICANAFSGNKRIEEVVFDESNDIQYIGEGAFAGCKNLTDIELPSTITEIKPYTFAWCGLEYIEIHNFIQKIGERAFTNCRNLSRVDMGENVEEIGNYAFAWCVELSSFTVPEKTKKLGYEILQANRDLDTLYYNAINCEVSGAYYDERVERTIGAFEGNSGLSEVVFGYRVELIPEYLLYNCTLVDSLYFPKSIKKVSRFALHNTEWFYGVNNEFVYVNDILYHYKGNDKEIDGYRFKENVRSIADNCFYAKDIEKIELPQTIQYIGNSAFEGCKYLKTISLPYDLEEVGDYAFKNCKLLRLVNFNNSLLRIGKYSFSGCEGLEKINLATSLKSIEVGAFYSCIGLIEANISEQMTEIPAGCFSNCLSLERVNIHDGITNIGEYAFAGCVRLDSISIPWDCEVIGSRAFSNCRELSALSINTRSVRIDPLAFYACENITDLNLMGTNRIGYKSFAKCSQLRNVVLGNELKTISNRAFEQCYSLLSLYVPQNVTQIGKFAFSKCKNLISIDIDNASIDIGDHAFSNCDGLINVDLGENIERIGKFAFSGCRSLKSISLFNPIEKIEAYCFYNCTELQSVKLPEGLEKIESNAFAKCSNLISIELPSSITEIGDMAFFNCHSITDIDLPQRINDIGEMAFWGCGELENIEIPVYLKKIGKNAFGECYNLRNIRFSAENCKAGHRVFSYTADKATVYIDKTVQKIDDCLFEGMNLEEVSIPNNVIKIGKLAFANSSALQDITIKSSGDIEIDNSAFNNTQWEENQTDEIVYLDNIAFKYIGKNMPTSITFRDGTTDIASNFMANNYKLKDVNLPQTLKSIGTHAFENCIGLEVVEFPNSLLNIHQGAFAGCHNLKWVKIPPYITNIGNFAFENCINIDSVHISNAYCSIGVGAFRNCNKMTYAYLGNNIMSIDDMAFAFCKNLSGINSKKAVILPSTIKIINSATFYLCEKLNGKITLPDNVTTIRDNAFYGCKKLHSIEISEKLDSISSSAFNGSHNFTRYFNKPNETFSVSNGVLYSKSKLTLYHCPEGYRGTCVVHKDAVKIEEKAFDNCTQIERIVLNNIVRIEDNAFNGCSNLRKVTIGKETQLIGSNIFDGCQSLLSIEVKNGNMYYKSVDGVLYSSDMKRLIYCPKAKKGVFRIPKSVEYIDDYAFYDCILLEKVILHKDIKQIGIEAFTGCKLERK